MSFTGELTLKDRATMAMRATYLITIFLPFIFLGPLLLFLADLLLKWSQDSKVQINGHRCSPFCLRSSALPWEGRLPHPQHARARDAVAHSNRPRHCDAVLADCTCNTAA